MINWRAGTKFEFKGLKVENYYLGWLDLLHIWRCSEHLGVVFLYTSFAGEVGHWEA
jgi:hypothetical protein